MQLERLKLLLEKVQSDQLDVDAALTELRNGFPEVIFGQGKRPEQIISIASRLGASCSCHLGATTPGSRPTDSFPCQVELVTPTGAAILAALATFERPSLTVTGLGVSAGKRNLPWPNIMRLIVGEAQRDFCLVSTRYGDVKIKQKIINGQVIQSMPEYDDCVRLANENGVSLADIYAEVNKKLE